MDAYDYGLPESAIAQEPVEPPERGPAAGRPRRWPATRRPGTPPWPTCPVCSRPGDVLVVNETRVLPARLDLAKATGGRAEVLLLEPVGRPEATGRGRVGGPGPARRRLPGPGTLLFEPPAAPGRPVVEVGGAGSTGRGRRPAGPPARPSVVDRAGVDAPAALHPPAPSAIPERYQTVYAAERALGERSAAAPTAGLHLTPELLDACGRPGPAVARVDLAIGLDTFRPVTAATAEDHVIHTERYSVPAGDGGRLRRRPAGWWPSGPPRCGPSSRRPPPGRCRAGPTSTSTATTASGWSTCWSPTSTCPARACCCWSRPSADRVWRDLYADALADGYRFLSFGDAMVVGPGGAEGHGRVRTSRPGAR